MAEASPPPHPAEESRSGCLRFLTTLAVVAFLTLVGAAWLFYDSIQQGVRWLSDLPSRLVEQRISDSFRQSVTQIISTQGDILEVATMQTDETITKYDMKTLFQDAVYLGTTVSEIRTPVFYRYHIRLSDAWDIQVQDGACIVHAPALRPSLPPAIRTDGLEKKSEAGWLRFNAAENLAALEKELTGTLEKRAGNPAHLNLVREKARESLAQFAQKWLMPAPQAPASPLRSITVIFPDETEPEALKRPPTLVLP